jgi:hypothetical protein
LFEKLKGTQPSFYFDKTGMDFFIPFEEGLSNNLFANFQIIL